MKRLASRVRRLEQTGGGPCGACGGFGPLVVLLDDEPMPDGRRCPRCGAATVVQLVPVTKEEWDAERAAKADRAA